MDDDIKFIVNDDYGIAGDKKIPYIAIVMNDVTMKHLPDRIKAAWYEVDGKRLFEHRNENGELTGDFVAFLILGEHEENCPMHPNYLAYITARVGGIIDLGDGKCRCK